MKPVCYLDLDGVICDFVRGAMEAHGSLMRPSEVRWDFHEQLGIAGSDFWKPFSKTFWENLQWTEEGPHLLNELEKIFGERIVLLTKPCETEGCVEGKVAWIKNHLPNYKRRYFIGPAKELAASPTKVLVDDSHGNTDQFIAEGGKAVLVPRPWNRLCGETDEKGRFDVQKVIGFVKQVLMTASWQFSTGRIGA